jgi:Molybdopterin biosynthesis enzyme
LYRKKIFRFCYLWEKTIFMCGRRMKILCMKMKQRRFCVMCASMRICIQRM